MVSIVWTQTTLDPHYDKELRRPRPKGRASKNEVVCIRASAAEVGLDELLYLRAHNVNVNFAVSVWWLSPEMAGACNNLWDRQILGLRKIRGGERGIAKLVGESYGPLQQGCH